MKKYLTVLLLLFAVSLYAKSTVKFDRLEHDFGMVQQETVVKATFTFKNTGNTLLVIERVKTSCGCTGTLLSSSELKPGEQGMLEISFDSGGYSGTIIRTITVLTNDPSHKEVKIHIKANVIESGDK